MRRFSSALIAAIVAVAACSDSSSPDVPPNTPAYSFVVMGCNRADKADTADDPSTANVVQLQRSFADIAALQPKPKYLFFAGDLVLGYTSDTTLLARELTEWLALYNASPLPASGITLVPIIGNHESQNESKIAYAAAERTWLRIMKPYLQFAGNGPHAGGADSLETDQDSLTYSFDDGSAHYVVLNTDPVGKDWQVAYHWVASDLASARSHGAKHLFLIGHKPAFPYPTIPDDGLSQFAPQRDAFWQALTTNHADAMFSAHNHVYYRSQPAGGQTWMIIAGNGGSLLEPTADPSLPSTGTYYGFTVATVTAGGSVYSKSYGRDIPAGGYAAPSSASETPTTVRDSVDITPR